MSARKRKKQRTYLGIARFLRYWYFRLVRLQGHPIEIARGLSVGVFSGFFPWFGLQIAIALILAILVRGNKIAAAAATWISNPFTSIPILIFNYQVGASILGRDLSVPDRYLFESTGNRPDDPASLGGEVLISLFLGSFVTGSIGAILTYFVSSRLIVRWRTRGRSQRKP